MCPNAKGVRLAVVDHNEYTYWCRPHLLLEELSQYDRLLPAILTLRQPRGEPRPPRIIHGTPSQHRLTNNFYTR